MEGDIDTDIIRMNNGNTKDNPLKFKLIEKEDIYVSDINILIYSLDDLKIPNNVHTVPVNIVFE